MKAPKSVKICGRKVAIHYEQLSDCIGIFDFNRGNPFIKLDSGLKGAMLADTAMHEALHAVYCISGLKGKDGEERTVTTIATHLTLIRDCDPEFFEWWCECK